MQQAQQVAALLSPFIGTVLGYYFGSASGERVARQATRDAQQAAGDKRAIQNMSAQELSYGVDHLSQMLRDDRMREVQTTFGLEFVKQLRELVDRMENANRQVRQM